jgi:hypothetical protein
LTKPTLHITVIFFCFFLSFLANGQVTSVKKKKAIFMGIGGASYNGDLGQGYGSSSLLFSFGLKLNTEKRLNGNFNVNIGAVTGQELDYVFNGNDPDATPNSYFNTSFFSLNYEAQFNILDQPNLKIYLSQGVGLIRFQPKDEFSNDLSTQAVTRPLGETYRNLTFVLPTQFGFNYILSNGLIIGFQSGLLSPITDYIDNISKWGNKSGNDNIITARIHFYFPIKF